MASANGLHDLHLRRVDDIEIAGRFGRNDGELAAVDERDRARPRPDLQLPFHLERGDVDEEHVAAGLAGDDERLAIGRERHAFRLLAQRDDVLDLAVGDVDGARGLHVLVRDIQLPAVLR